MRFAAFFTLCKIYTLLHRSKSTYRYTGTGTAPTNPRQGKDIDASAKTAASRADAPSGLTTVVPVKARCARSSLRFFAASVRRRMSSDLEWCSLPGPTRRDLPGSRGRNRRDVSRRSLLLTLVAIFEGPSDQPEEVFNR